MDRRVADSIDNLYSRDNKTHPDNNNMDRNKDYKDSWRTCSKRYKIIRRKMCLPNRSLIIYGTYLKTIFFCENIDKIDLEKSWFTYSS